MKLTKAQRQSVIWALQMEVRRLSDELSVIMTYAKYTKTNHKREINRLTKQILEFNELIAIHRAEKDQK